MPVTRTARQRTTQWLAAGALTFAAHFAFAADQSVPFGVEQLVELKRASDPRISPSGAQVLYALRETDLQANKGVTGLWEIPFAGGAAKRLTEAGTSVSSGRYAADGQSVYFLSAKDGSNQLWRQARGGKPATRVSDLALDIGSYVIAPDGKRVAFSVEIYPECGADFSCSKARAEQKPTQTGVLQTQLFMRHWDTWSTGARAQLFVARLSESGLSDIKHVSVNPAGQAMDGDVPSKPHGDESEYAFSPDSKALVFSIRLAGKTEAWSTNFDLYRAALDTNSAPVNLTASNLAGDTAPVFAPDGKKLYYKAMSKPGFEADRYRLLEHDFARDSTREIAAGWDRSAAALLISDDGKTLVTYADDLGNRRAFAIEIATGKVRALSDLGAISGISLRGNKIAYVKDDLSAPAELYTGNLAKAKRITALNADALKNVRFGASEQFTFAGWNGETVHAWMVKPADFDAKKQYPVAFLIHGGPQGSFGNQFHYRWNPQTYAGQGFVSIMVDFHGSTGYGQAFTDSISTDWGGKPLEDLKKGLAAAQARYPFIDRTRSCALGGSYGGYMTNWIAGAWPDGFKCLVTHAGIFDKRFMAYSTEELWFSEWENGGTPWQQTDTIEKDNPVNLIEQWRTPMLVIHGMKDFRVPFEQGISAFTTLQRKGIDSQFLWYADENHWILKPKNSIQWHNAVNSWLHKHLDQ